MRSGISEFSYGYAITEALVRDNGTLITAAPVFPSLIEEGRSGGGYDLKLDLPGLPLFIQFKLSEYMTGRTNTPEIRDALFSGRFYRMHLRPLRRSDQHNLLLDLESGGNEVYYVAPLFHELNELNSCYLNKQVLQNSVFFRPSDIGSLPDNDEHHVSFQASGNAYLCSQPKQISPANDFKLIARHIYDRLQNQPLSLRELLPSLYTHLDQIIYERSLDRETRQILFELRDTGNLVDQVSLLARTYFDCNLFIAQERPT